jgi:hypothetical protein
MKLLQFFWMRWPRVPRKGCQLDVDRHDSVNLSALLHILESSEFIFCIYALCGCL